MVSIRSVLIASLALVSGVAADQLVISPNRLKTAAAVFAVLFENTPGVTVTNGVLSPGCFTGAEGNVRSFTAGNSIYDIDHGVQLLGGCTISGDITLPVENTLSVNYFFFTYKDTDTTVLTSNDAFALSVDNLDANSGPTPPSVVYSVQNLINQNANIGTRPSNVGVTVLPKGNDKITIKLTNNAPTGAPSGVAIAPFTLTASATGDPQISGFLGQSFQVHGSSNTVYNIISTPDFQYNAKFDFLSEGQCRQGTECFAHAGNYFSQVGVMIQDGATTDKIQIDSGAVDVGLKVMINDEAMTIGSSKQIGAYKVTLLSKFEVALDSKEFSLVLQNSDKFLNQMVAIGSGLQSTIRQYKLAQSTGASASSSIMASLPHGILGQTWQSKTYDNRWKHIQGQLFDYIQPEGIFGTSNKFNRFA